MQSIAMAPQAMVADSSSYAHVSMQAAPMQAAMMQAPPMMQAAMAAGQVDMTGAQVPTIMAAAPMILAQWHTA